MNPAVFEGRTIPRSHPLESKSVKEGRTISRSHSLDSNSVKEVVYVKTFPTAHSDDEELHPSSRKKKGAREEETLDDTSDLEDLLNAGKEELLKTEVLSLKYLAPERIVSLMQLILDIGGHVPTDCRLLPKLALWHPAAPGLRKWSKLMVSMMRTFVTIRLITAPRELRRMITMPRGLRNAAIQMSETVADVLEGRYLPCLEHLALPPCHISTIVRALIQGPVATLQHLELCGHSDPSPFSNTRPLRRLFMSDLLEGLQHLGLSRCMEDEEIEGLATALKAGKIPRLRRLDLSRNFFQGSTISKSLATLMRCRVLRSLEHLNLNSCHITDEGVQAVANSIMAKGPWKLKILDLGSNEIGDAGFAALLKLVKSDRLPDLQELHLLYNYGIGEEQKLEAAKILENGHVPQLQVVYLSSHIISERVAEAFLTAYKNNTALFVELRNVLWPNELIERGVARFRERNLGLIYSARKAMQCQ